MRAHRIPVAMIAAAAGAGLLACSPTNQSERETPDSKPQPTSGTAAAEPAQALPAPPERETIGGDGSPIRLSPLQREEIYAAKLRGELGCSFEDGSRRTLLVAMGDVASDEPSFGLVKVGNQVEPVSAPGGFDAMIKGASFIGKGKTIRVETTASQPVGGGEAPPYPARLTYQRADGAGRSFDGTWACGP